MISVSDRTRWRLPTALAGLGAVACVACCALPLLLAAGAFSGAGWVITGRWLPAVAGLLIASAAVLWWTFRRRRHQQGCSGPSGMFLRSRMTYDVAAPLTVGSEPCWS